MGNSDICTEAGEETMVFGAVTVGAKDKLLLGDEADGLGEEARVSASGSDRYAENGESST